MYSWEIEKFIEGRNYRVGGDDLLILVEVKNHPQITSMSYDAFNHVYTITTSDNYNMMFEAMLLDEAKEKGLVKKLIKK